MAWRPRLFSDKISLSQPLTQRDNPVIAFVSFMILQESRLILFAMTPLNPNLYLMTLLNTTRTIRSDFQYKRKKYIYTEMVS